MNKVQCILLNNTMTHVGHLNSTTYYTYVFINQQSVKPCPLETT